MAVHAGRALFEQGIGDRRGNAQRGVLVWVYDRGTSNLSTLYTDRTKVTEQDNPLTTNGLGNLAIFADPGDYEAHVDSTGAVLYFTVLPDWEDVVTGDEPEGGLPAHLADAVDAHDASAVSFVPAGSLAATTVQAALVELDSEKVGLAGDETLTGIKTFERTAPDEDQTVTVEWTAVPDTGGAQGFILDRTTDTRPLGFVFKTAGVAQNAIALDAGTSDIILSWSPITPGDQFRIREGCHALLGRSVGHPTDEYRLRLDSVVGDPAAMADLLYLGVNTAAPTLRALRITNETNTLLAVKADNSGVGIGTLTPGAQLHVVRSQDATTQFLLANGNNTASAKASTRVQSASGSVFIESYPALFTTTALAGHSFIYTTGTSDLILGTAGTDRIHLAANGRVGMGGVTVPAAWLDINAPSDLAVLRLQMAASAATNPFVIVDSLAAAVFAVSSAGRVFANTGSAASAGIGFLSDPNTGIFSNAVDNLQFTTGGAERMRLDSLGNIVLGALAALATSATDKFVYMPSMAGTPTGVPTSKAGMVPTVIDTTASKLWAYIGGAWKSVALA